MTGPGAHAEVPWWGVLSAAAAPVLLVGGWTLAASLQQNGFDQVAGTISALAALDADRRWVMTVAVAGTGLCHVATALALRSASTPGRWWYALGGLATVAVAAFPLPAGGSEGGAPLHVLAASAAFGLLGTWPLVERLARGRRVVAPPPAGLRTPASRAGPSSCSAPWRGSAPSSVATGWDWPSGSPRRARPGGRSWWC